LEGSGETKAKARADAKDERQAFGRVVCAFGAACYGTAEAVPLSKTVWGTRYGSRLPARLVVAGLKACP